jgi:hypothetical protein
VSVSCAESTAQQTKNTAAAAAKKKKLQLPHTPTLAPTPHPTLPQAPTGVLFGHSGIACTVGKWSSIAGCSRSCGPDGMMTSTRPIVKYPQHGGKKCPPLVKTESCNKKVSGLQVQTVQCRQCSRAIHCLTCSDLLSPLCTWIPSTRCAPLTVCSPRGVDGPNVPTPAARGTKSAPGLSSGGLLGQKANSARGSTTTRRTCSYRCGVHMPSLYASRLVVLVI